LSMPRFLILRLGPEAPSLDDASGIRVDVITAFVLPFFEG
jgi:hypothetical protein